MREFRPGVTKQPFRPARFFEPYPDPQYFGDELIGKSFDSVEIVRIISRRIQELKNRGFPDEWIEKDLIKFVESL